MSMTNEQIQELKGNLVIDPYYLVECGNCAEIYPSNKLAGGYQIADTGDYGDCYCPHCDASEEYEDLGNNAASAWNYQQKRIDALLAERDADKALIAELKHDFDAANARVDAGCAQLCKQDDLIATLRDACSQWERKAISNFEECAEMSARIEELESQRKLAFTASNRWADKFRDAEKRIAELEGALNLASASYAGERERADALQARTVTVKLPQRCECCYSEKEAALFDGVVEEYTEALESACAAAGIPLVLGE